MPVEPAGPTRVEQQTIAQTIPMMTIARLARSDQYGYGGNIINLAGSLLTRRVLIDRQERIPRRVQNVERGL